MEGLGSRRPPPRRMVAADLVSLGTGFFLFETGLGFFSKRSGAGREKASGGVWPCGAERGVIQTISIDALWMLIILLVLNTYKYVFQYSFYNWIDNLNRRIIYFDNLNRRIIYFEMVGKDNLYLL
jgi:hypothetical protein